MCTGVRACMRACGCAGVHAGVRARVHTEPQRKRKRISSDEASLHDLPAELLIFKLSAPDILALASTRYSYLCQYMIILKY